MRFYFRRVFVANWHRIPTDKPVFLAVNHANSFLDAIFLCVYRTKPIYSLARGDVFSKPWAAWLLRRFKMEPIFRAMDGGLENAKKNDETTEVCRKLLHNGNTVLIFPEGICVPEKRLRPLKKGVSRMAMQIAADSDFALDLQIVPVGINYTQFGGWRGEVMVEVGEPIAVQDYAAMYAQQPAKAIKQLNEAIEQQLKENVLQIHAPEDDQPVETLLEMERSQEPTAILPWAKSTNNQAHSNRYTRERAIAQHINILRQTQPEVHADLMKTAGEYQAALRSAKVHERSVAKATQYRWRWLLTWLFAPMGVAGWLINGLPLWYAHRVAVKKSAGTQFFDSVNVGLGVNLYLPYWLMAAVVLHFTAGSGWYALGMPICLWIAAIWRDAVVMYGRYIGSDTLQKLVEKRNTLQAMYSSDLALVSRH